MYACGLVSSTPPLAVSLTSLAVQLVVNLYMLTSPEIIITSAKRSAALVKTLKASKKRCGDGYHLLSKELNATASREHQNLK